MINGPRALKRKRTRRGPIVQNGPELAEYKDRKNRLKIKIKKSKRNCWENLCKQADVDPWGLPLG